MGAVFRNYDFDGDIIWQGIFHSGTYQLLNYYEFGWDIGYNPQTINNRLTRGGPLAFNPEGYEIDFNVGSDGSKSWILSAAVNSYHQELSEFWTFETTFEIRPSSNVTFSLSPFYEYNHDFSQYLDTYDDPFASATFGKRYIFGDLIQKTMGASIRASWTFTPKLSLQLYMQSLISRGKYGAYKELAKPRSYDFLTYGEGNSTFDEENYIADPDGSGGADPIEIGNRDFNIISLRGNAVLRWEYLPGSVVYFVWTQTRSDYRSDQFGFRKSADQLLELHPDNIFLIKFTYWFNM